jgi:hypothetical protein
MREGPDLGYGPTEVYESSDGAGFALINESIAEGVTGYVEGTIPTGPVGFWDLATEITVQLHSTDTLSSSTDADVLAGVDGWYLCGGEVIGAVTVTALGDGRYTFSRLLRGLVDTEGEVGLHAANEPFLQVRPTTRVTKHAYVEGDIGTTRSYKAVPVGADEADYPSKAAVMSGSTMRPFAPALTEATRHTPATDDWSGSFTPRTRSPLLAIFGTTPPDLLEDVEDYIVEVWDSASYTTLKDTLTTTADTNGSVVDATAHTVFYDELDQIAAFGSAQSTLYLRVIQIGDTGLRSKPQEVTIT